MQIQRELAARVVERDDLRDVGKVAGVDVGLERMDKKNVRAAVVVLRLPDLVPLDYVIARLPTKFPYIPGHLAFRELPVIMRALEQLRRSPI